jgi:serine phosphatase RsbU (regulator of sigma subunit)
MELKARIRSALSLSFANKELKSTYEVVLEQKIKIEDSSRKMTDSIRYAKRIQQAILPLTENIEEHLKEFFIIYKPLDIISGDFYYFEAVEKHLVLATIDCTGHGVPGALMSMLGKEILNKIIIDKKIFEPDKILLELDKGIKSALQQDETDNQDGMDISILVIDTMQKKASYSGAKNPIIFISNGELKEIKGSPFGIGGDYGSSTKQFDIEVFDIISPTMFYLFSDGFQDQFGGVRNKKFMISKMRELFKEIYEKSTDEQKNILFETIENWIKEGNENQTDDIMLWGFRI